MTPLIIIVGYLTLLLGLGLGANRLLKSSSEDYQLASHSIGPFLLLMSLFGTTMTGFALVGSTGEAYKIGVATFALLASCSAISHSLCFHLLGVKLWTFGQRHGHRTQIQFFRDRLESDAIGWWLFPVLVGLVVVYLLIGVIPSGIVIQGVTRGAFPEVFPETAGGVPKSIGSLVVCLVVLSYVFFGGMRGTAWANAFQTAVFMLLGVVTFFTIANALGGPAAATAAVVERAPEKLVHRGAISQPEYLSFLLIPFTVGALPHVFQHWLTAKSASTFKLPIVGQPIFIMIVWLPCVLLGVWATSITTGDGSLMFPPGPPDAGGTNPNAVLAIMVARFTNPVLAGLLSAGILAAIMSSLDSQFLCVGTMFTEDVVRHHYGKRIDDARMLLVSRLFVVGVVAATYGLSLLPMPRLFRLGLWCFAGFTALVPLTLAACYWRRLTAAGAIASVATTVVTGGLLLWDSGFVKDPTYTFLGMLPIATMTLAATIAMIAVSLVTQPPSDETIAKYFG